MHSVCVVGNCIYGHKSPTGNVNTIGVVNTVFRMHQEMEFLEDKWRAIFYDPEQDKLYSMKFSTPEKKDIQELLENLGYEVKEIKEI